MRWLLVIALLAGRAYADDPVAAAKAWWAAAPTHKAGPVDYSVSTTTDNKCKPLGHGKATDKAAQTKLGDCVADVKVELGWKLGKLKDVKATNSSLKPQKTDRIVMASSENTDANLQIYFAVDPKGVVRRVWVAESFFE